MILIDFDGVIVDTVQMFVRLNNELNGMEDDYRLCEDYNFRPICKNLKTKKEVDELFRYKKLYEDPIFFNNAIEVINRLNEKYDIAICTMGDNINIINKLNLIDKYFPKVNVIPIVNNDGSLTKNNVVADILIDDHKGNLQSENISISILFEPTKKFKWNEGWDGVTINTWLEFEKVVKFIYG